MARESRLCRPLARFRAGRLLLAVALGPALLAQEGAPPPFPPPGRLVDIGGWRLHLHCIGQRQPGSSLVVFEPGIGDFSVEWNLVQPDVATFERVCSYDGPLRIADIPANALAAMRAGIAETVPHANDPPRDKLPPDAMQMRTWALAQIGHIAAGVNPFETEEIALLRTERKTTDQPYGDMPLVVITRGIPESDETATRGDERLREHQAIAVASRRGRWRLRSAADITCRSINPTS